MSKEPISIDPYRCNGHRMSSTSYDVSNVYQNARKLVSDAWEWLPSSMLRDRDLDESMMLAAAEAVDSFVSTIELEVSRQSATRAYSEVEMGIGDMGFLFVALAVYHGDYEFTASMWYALPGSANRLSCEIRIGDKSHFWSFSQRACDIGSLLSHDNRVVIDANNPRTIARATTQSAFDVAKNTDWWEWFIGTSKRPENEPSGGIRKLK